MAEVKDAVQQAISQLSMCQSMINYKARQLCGLRTQCSTTEEITQAEIREAESKLIILFSKLLVAKANLNAAHIPDQLQASPNTEQWLTIVGINSDAVMGISRRGLSVQSLMDMSEDQIGLLLGHFGASPDDVHRLSIALRNLRDCTRVLRLTGKGPDIELHWTSYKSASNSPYGGSSPKLPHCPRTSTSSLPPDAFLNAQSPSTPPQSTPTSPTPLHLQARHTPPSTPSLVKTTANKGRFPTTPPPQKKNKVENLYPEVFPLTKSKSHESQLSHRVNVETESSKSPRKKPRNLSLAGSCDKICERRKSAESTDAARIPSGQSSPLITSPKRSPPHKHMNTNDFYAFPPEVEIHPKKNFLVPPVSPKARTLLSPKTHRFTNTFKITTCDICQKQMFLGYKCKECKFETKIILNSCDMCQKKIVGRCRSCKECKQKFHKDCASKAPQFCGINYDSVISGEVSPNIGRKVKNTMSLPTNGGNMLRQASSVPVFHVPDSSSGNTSSCNSSTPSSPALFNTTYQINASPHNLKSPATQFEYPETNRECSETSGSTPTMDSVGSTSGIGTWDSMSRSDGGFRDNADFISTNTSNDSDKSDKTLIDSGNSEVGLSERPALLDRVDSQESQDDTPWHRNNSISITLREWCIPYEQLEFGDIIGTGRFGKVYRGKWHGNVAIKMLNMEKSDNQSKDQSQLQAFKLEVAMLRKTRHENLVLFMGACMSPPNLAIVTSLCKGKTLYNVIHERKEKINMNRGVIIASQIAQGMGYLHARDIVHKDLKTKNIFLESGKVVITDFGLFNVTKICQGNRKGEWLSIPPGWLCYLSPEIMRALHASNRQDINLPFSEASDIFAFGTVWYELLCGEWPFKNQPPEAIIWQVGKGMKQSLGNLHTSRDVKEVLMLCWSYKPDDRPGFSKLLKNLQLLPKKRLARSPSHPIQLSRSAESVI